MSGRPRILVPSASAVAAVAIHIVNRRDMKSAILQPPRHVRAHPANANKTDVHVIFAKLGREGYAAGRSRQLESI